MFFWMYSRIAWWYVLQKRRRGGPVLDQGRDRVLGPLELHLPRVVVVEERGRDFGDAVALLECLKGSALHRRAGSHAVAVEADGLGELEGEVTGQRCEVPRPLVLARVEDDDNGLGTPCTIFQ
jgi:hypothetical protein